MRKVGILLGGMGSERDVSRKTGQAFVNSVKRLGFPFEVIEVGPDLPRVLSQSKIDCALIALHGKFGEDGTVQGLLEYMKIPYTGSGVLASALAMNKAATKQILTHWGVPTAEFELVDLKMIRPGEVKLAKLETPVVVKPTHEGSTVGVTIVKNQDELKSAVEAAGKFGSTVLIEKFIDGMEISIPVWMDRVLPIIEIIPKTAFYDYQRKYTPGASEHVIPARLPEKLKGQCEGYALETFRTVGCRHYARVDMRVDKSGRPYVLEINTLPGCTETSLFPESAATVGITFDEVTKTLIENATLDYV